MGRTLDRLQRFAFSGFMYYLDLISGLNQTALKNNAHDSCFANERAVFCTPQYRREETRLEVLDLRAWIAKPRDFHNGVGANTQLRTSCQRKEINSSCCNVLAHLSGSGAKFGSRDVGEEFLVKEMNLLKIRLGRISGDS